MELIGIVLFSVYEHYDYFAKFTNLSSFDVIIDCNRKIHISVCKYEVLCFETITDQSSWCTLVQSYSCNDNCVKLFPWWVNLDECNWRKCQFRNTCKEEQMLIQDGRSVIIPLYQITAFNFFSYILDKIFYTRWKYFSNTLNYISDWKVSNGGINSQGRKTWL